jgi:hypothetical protein
MSEEKPTFKVTDRRLFNPDGTPRDIPREEEPQPAPEPQQQAAPPATESPAAEAARTAPATPAEAATPRAAAAEAEPEPQAEAQGDEGFLMLVEFLASFAADALGMVNHPGGGGGVNLPLAKQCIDMLGTLQRKTRGNLVGEEQQFLDMILSQLRMQYVSLTSAPRPPKGGGPRGFTGGDITGGR